MASLFGLDKIRVLCRSHSTPPMAAEESGRPHFVGPRAGSWLAAALGDLLGHPQGEVLERLR